MKSTSSPLPDYIQRDLETFRKAFAAGNEAGLFDALVFCKREKLTLPDWALDASIIRQREYIFGETKRHAKWQRQFRQDMIDMGRAEMVKDCRDHGAPWKAVYDAASRMIGGTEDEGKPDAIEKSYKRFTRTMKSNPWRYYIPRFIRLKERRTRHDPEYDKWFEKTFPFTKECGVRRYK